MKPVRRLAAIAVLAGLLPCLAPAEANEPSGSAAAPVEIVGEPMHHVRLLSSTVRVYEALIPAGESTLFHTHRFSGVGVDMTAVRLEVEKVGVPPEQFDTVPGDIWPANAAQPYSHRVANRGSIPFRSVVVERLNAPSASAQPSLSLRESHYKLELENDLFRAYRLTLRPGESTSAAALAPQTVVISVSGGQIVWRSADDSGNLRSIAPGDVQWISESTPISILNAGVADFVYVLVELK